MKITATNIGERVKVAYKGKVVETGIFKKQVFEPIFLGEEDVAGDAVVDRKYHGGVEQAVYAYGEEHYHFWRKKFPNANWEYGMFGENLTVSELEETEIHVGDTYKVGEVIIEVTKPREPCMKLGLRFGTQKVLKDFWNSTKSGVYFKVLQTGNVREGDTFELIKRDTSKPTIAQVYEGLKP